MPVVLTRVDDRLLHGQVVEGWVPYVRAEKVVVVSDTVCLEPDRCRLMELIVPNHIELEVTPLEELSSRLSRAVEVRTLLLFEKLQDVLSVLDAGVRIEKVNVGNLHNVKGGMEVTPSVYLNRGDMDTIRRLVLKGVSVEAREVPDGLAIDLSSYVRNNESVP